MLDEAQLHSIPTTDDIHRLVTARATTHGDWNDHATITQYLKSIIHDHPGWIGLTAMQRESLDMIMHKVGRILAGDPNHPDHWDDISGYAHITSERLPSPGVTRR